MSANIFETKPVQLTSSVDDEQEDQMEPFVLDLGGDDDGKDSKDHKGGDSGKDPDNDTGDDIPPGKDLTTDEEDTPHKPGDGGKYDHLSEGALFALQYKKDGVLPGDFEIPEDITMSELKDAIYSRWLSDLENNKMEHLQKMGYTEETLEYVEFLKKGGNPSEIATMHRGTELSTLEIDKDTDESVENRKRLILEMYKDKGISEARANDFYEISLEKGEDRVEAQEAKTYFNSKRQQITARQQEEDRKRREMDAENARKEIEKTKNIIRGKTLAGVKLTDYEAKELEKSIFNKTEEVQYTTPDGKVNTQKISKYQKYYNDFINDPEQQILLAYLLTTGKGLKKEALKSQSTIKNEDDILESIARRKRNTSSDSGDDLRRFLP